MAWDKLLRPACGSLGRRRSARIQASQLLSDPNISRAVEEGYRVVMEEASRRCESAILEWKDVVQRDSEIANFDPASVLEWDDRGMQIKPMSMVPLSARQCISSIRETRDSLAVTFVNPHPSLDRLPRHHTVLSRGRPVEAVERSNYRPTMKLRPRRIGWSPCRHSLGPQMSGKSLRSSGRRLRPKLSPVASLPVPCGCL